MRAAVDGDGDGAPNRTATEREEVQLAPSQLPPATDAVGACDWIGVFRARVRAIVDAPDSAASHAARLLRGEVPLPLPASPGAGGQGKGGEDEGLVGPLREILKRGVAVATRPAGAVARPVPPHAAPAPLTSIYFDGAAAAAAAPAPSWTASARVAYPLAGDEAALARSAAAVDAEAEAIKSRVRLARWSGGARPPSTAASLPVAPGRVGGDAAGAAVQALAHQIASLREGAQGGGEAPPPRAPVALFAPTAGVRLGWGGAGSLPPSYPPAPVAVRKGVPRGVGGGQESSTAVVPPALPKPSKVHGLSPHERAAQEVLLARYAPEATGGAGGRREAEVFDARLLPAPPPREPAVVPYPPLAPPPRSRRGSSASSTRRRVDFTPRPSAPDLRGPDLSISGIEVGPPRVPSRSDEPQTDSSRRKFDLGDGDGDGSLDESGASLQGSSEWQAPRAGTRGGVAGSKAGGVPGWRPEGKKTRQP